MLWQRTKNLAAAWEDVPLNRVPASVLRRYSGRVKRGDCLIVAAYSYYYRLLFCV